MTKTKLFLNLPTTITADDYHEFQQISNVFNALQLKLTVEEVDCRDGYVAIVYHKKNKEYRALKKELQKDFETNTPMLTHR